MQQRPPRQRLSSNAVVLADFQWGTFHLDEESAKRSLANWRAMLEESRFFIHLNRLRTTNQSAKCWSGVI
jgi:hypothetical protein